MGAETIGSEGAVACWASTSSQFFFSERGVGALPWIRSHRVDHPIHPSYKATGGFCREDAIMILRRFYITENTNGSFSIHVIRMVAHPPNLSSRPSIKSKSRTQNGH